MTDEDLRLREAFRRLRSHDARRSPPFQAPTSEPRHRSSRGHPLWLVVGPLAAAAALLFYMCGKEPSRPPLAASTPPSEGPASARGIAGAEHDSAPLDFLLSSPTTSFLGRLPDFDSDPVSKGLPR